MPVNGVVSLAQARERHLLPEEIAVVKAALEAHPKTHNYRLDVKPERLVVHEREVPDMDGLLGIFGARFGMPPGKEQQLRDELVQRGRTRGHIDDWIFVNRGDLADLAETLVPTLGTDAFFELY